MEVNRLQQLMRTKQLLDAHWNVERWSPISALNVEICTSIFLPTPIVIGSGMTQFSFPLLNGSAEIVMEILSDDDDNSNNNDDDFSAFSGSSDTSKSMTAKVSQLGCFIKDGGSAMKLLKAILLGDSDVITRVDNSFFGPYPLRRSLSSFIIGDVGSNCFRDEVLHRSSLIVSRIDTIVRSVRELEVDCSTCCIDIDKTGKDVFLSVSISLEFNMNIELVVQINFLFDNLLHDSWCIMSLAPTNVHVSIISNSTDEVSRSSLLLGNQCKREHNV